MKNRHLQKNFTKQFLIGACLSAALFLFSAAAARADQIDNYQTTIKINPDSSLDVRENIIYDFGDQPKHGILRDIPLQYQRDSFNYNLRISGITVTDANETPQPFTQSFSGGEIHLKIGDPDILVSGANDYIINYKIQRALNYFADGDELYWNAIGFSWPVAIKQASTVVILPKLVNASALKIKCYFGAYGSQNICSDETGTGPNGETTVKFNLPSIAPADITLAPATTVTAALPAALEADQGQTIVVNFPKGLVAPLSARDNIIFFLEDNWPLALPILLLIIMTLVWLKYGRDPKGRGTIIAQYDVPDKLTPLEVGTVMDATADNKDLSAEIIYLATQGYVKITNVKPAGLLAAADYQLDKLKEPAAELANFDADLLATIFYDNRKTVTTSELKDHFARSKAFKVVTDDVYADMETKKIFVRNPYKVKKIFITISSIMFGVPLLFALSGNAIYSETVIMSIVACVFIVSSFAAIMPKKTEHGAWLKEYISGLKLYLSVAEKDRINFANAPEKNPQTFEKFLPYAMVLGVEKQWAGQFADIYNNPPGWYAPYPGSGFSVIAFSGDLGHFSGQVNGVFASSGQSAAGGGGFGGGGGGGGGGW